MTALKESFNGEGKSTLAKGFDSNTQSLKSDQALKVVNILDLDVERFIEELENILLERRFSDLSKLSAEDQFKLIKSRACEILPEEELLKKLQESKETWRPLKIKFWIDPTGSDIHIWHSIPMIFMNRFQRMGHEIIFIIGDFTAKIWDPTWRVDSRPPLTDEQIKKNFSTYKEQIRPFFDLNKAKIVHNWEWLNKIELKDLISTMSKVSVSAVLQREDFRNRLENWSGLSMAELIYPIVMWMDSVYLGKSPDYWCDVEIWWKDQFLNMQMCRRLMENDWMRVETIITSDMLEGTTWGWKKMSKSLKNYVALTHDPDEIYWRVMSIPDSLMEKYFKFLTEIYDEEWTKLSQLISKNEINPMNVKKMLARIIVEVLHDKEAAKQAGINFDLKFSKRDYSNIEDLKTYELDPNNTIVDFLAWNWFATSKWNARKLIEWGWVQIITWDKPEKITGFWAFKDIMPENRMEFILKIWKKNIVKIVLA